MIKLITRSSNLSMYILILSQLVIVNLARSNNKSIIFRTSYYNYFSIRNNKFVNEFIDRMTTI